MSPSSASGGRGVRVAVVVSVAIVLLASIVAAFVWPQYRTLQLLRELAELPDRGEPFHYASEFRSYMALYPAAGCYVFDFGRVRVALQGAVHGSESGAEVPISGDRGATMSHHASHGSWSSYSFVYAGDRGAGTVTIGDPTRGTPSATVEFTVGDGIIEIDGRRFPVQGDRKVVLIDTAGKILRVRETPTGVGPPPVDAREP